jgi:hypothetical protein
MVDLGVCKPDMFCPKIKNPANYAIAKQRMMARLAERKGRKKSSVSDSQAPQSL